MAELDQLRARAEAARTVHHAVGGATFTLRVPSRHAARVAWLRHQGRAAPVLAERELLEQAIVAWQGVTVGMLLGPEAPDAADPVAWDPLAVAMLFDAQPAIETALSARLSEEAAKRNAEIVAAEKN